MEFSPARPSRQRALAAIVLTDAVSFSARMSVDEEGTLALIQRDLKLISDLCEQYEGQVLKSTGDGLLMAFVSAVQAVSCSQEIQKRLANFAEGLPPEEFLQHRIGIHLGDVLFSHSDVLGNGVNIAARLQTQSTPGGICISQIVYDVVKARLHLNVIFLGPLRLKNIREPVPAYQIPPVGETATMLSVQEPVTEFSQPPNPLRQAVQQLQEDANHRRIKKLLFGTCQGVWENDMTVLSQFDLQELVQTLCRRHATLDALETALNNIIARLNRQGDYIAVASCILSALQPVYAQAIADASELEDVTDIPEAISVYDRAAARLTQSSQARRIQKLLYAVANNTWENDMAVIAGYEMGTLVAAVHQIAPTMKELTYHLERVIKRLNRQEQYAQVAEMITEALSSVYAPEQPIHFSEPTGMVSATLPNTSMMLSTAMGSSYEGEFLTSMTRLSPGAPAPGDGTVSYGTPPPRPVGQRVSADPHRVRDRRNLYPLRLEIMRYTNPLRAKILLLSTVRSPFAFNQQDWLTLKTKTLEELVREAFNYCPSFADLESKLTIISHCLDDVDENTQTAGAILQAMKPYYPTNADRSSAVSPA